MVEPRDGSDDDGDNNIYDGNAIKKFGLCFDLIFQKEKYCHLDSCKQGLRSLFDQVVVAFLRDKSAGKCHRPLPALCGDGRPVDLFKLFWLVKKFGGYDAVSRENLWGLVSDECGLGCGVIASLKLIYMNYLNELDQWLQQVFSKRVLEDDHCEFIRKLDLLSRELEIRFEGLLPNKQKQEQLEKIDRARSTIDAHASSGKSAEAKIANEVNGFSSDGNIISEQRLRARTTIVAVENSDENYFPNESCVFAKKVVTKVYSRKPDRPEKVPESEERSRAQPSIDDFNTCKTDVGNVLASRKRKHQSHSFSGMLRWLIQVAKRSDDSSVGSIPDCSKWNDGYGEFWAEALLAREALLVKRHARKTAVEVLLKDQQKKQRMLPMMYEDEVINHQTTEKLRHSRRIPITKSHSCSCCHPSASPQTKDINHREADSPRLGEPSEVAVTAVKEEQPSTVNDHNPFDMPAERKVSIGFRFQAAVPQWTGIVSDSDSKWLGTRMWPPEDSSRNSTTRASPVGKRRQHPCNCSFPNSVECVRFHVAEKRLELKQELGSLFYRWRFNLMGEEVSLSWTEEEERVFKDNMKSYAAFSNKFWNNAWRFLPSKSREKLVSYYFNVYLIQRRSYQNRVTPRDVDSDDDEKVCGSIGGRLGHKALYVPRPSSISCTLNTESTEFV